MKVIQGLYKGRNIQGFDIEGTRATMDRVKESMFAMIQNRVKDAHVLDLFAGTGSLGLEALSMGAKVCYFVDNNPVAINAIKNNLKGIENAKIINLDYNKALKSFRDDEIKFDIIILDPPYDRCFINKILNFIYDNNLLSDKGIIVTEYEEEKVSNEKFHIYKERIYGTKHVTIFDIE